MAGGSEKSLVVSLGHGMGEALEHGDCCGPGRPALIEAVELHDHRDTIVERLHGADELVELDVLPREIETRAEPKVVACEIAPCSAVAMHPAQVVDAKLLEHVVFGPVPASG